MKKKTAREKETPRGKATKTSPSKRGPVQDLEVRDRERTIKGGLRYPPPC
jgi:hypothetical protein